MQKPQIILIEEMRQEIADVINKYASQVPAVTMADFFDKLATETHAIASQQLARAKQQYEESLKAESEVKDNVGEEDNRTGSK